MPGRLIESKNTEAAGILIKDLTRDNPQAGDIVPFFDLSGDDTNGATVQQIVSAGLPAGNATAEVLAWSPTNTWAPLPAELVVQHGLPRGNHMGDLLFWNDTHGAWAPSPAAPLALNIVGGAGGSIPYQNNPESTHFLPIGTDGQVLTVGANGTPGWDSLSKDVSTIPYGTGTLTDGATLHVTGAATSAHNIPTSLEFTRAVSLENLSFVGSSLVSFKVPKCLTTNGVLKFENCPNLTTVDLRNITNFNSVLTIKNCPEIGTLINLCTNGGSPLGIQVSSCAKLYGFFGSPTAILGNLIVEDCPLFDYLSTSFRRIDGNISFRGCAFKTGTINGLLAKLSSLDGTGSKSRFGAGQTVNLSGGTNEAPTGQGIIDAQTLIARGCTVTVNGSAITTTKKAATFAIPDFDTVADRGRTLKVKADGTGLEWVA